jgi:lysophospholipase L1-like esterase
VLPSRRLAAVSVALCAAFCAALCAVALAGCGKKPPPPPPEVANYYVALGDSFTAAAGYGPFTDQVCRRAADDYPSLVAEKLKIAAFADVSCGAATVDSLTQSEVIPQQGTRQAQLNAVSAGTKVITVGLGLNDSVNPQGVTLSSVLTTVCVPDQGKYTDACNAYVQLPESNMSDAVDTMAEQVGSGLDRIRQRAPEARIIFVGYPRLLPDVGDCPKLVPFPPIALNRLRSTLRQTNEALARVARTHHVEYVDMYTASKGHDVCSAQPWVNGYKVRKGKGYPFHPYKSYHEAVAAKIVALLRTKKPQA